MSNTIKTELGEAIATRILHYTSGKGEQSLTIQLGKPRPLSGGDWECPIWVGEEQKLAFGVDSYQALSMALQLISIEVRCLENKQKIQFNWLGMDELGLEPVRE